MRNVGERQSVKGRKNYGYGRVSVAMEERAGYEEFGCDTTISVEGDVLCVVNKGLEGMERMLK